MTISTPNVTINANGAALQATNDTTSAVKITGNGVSLSNLNLTAPLTGSRCSNLDQNSLDIMADNVTVNNVTVTGQPQQAYSSTGQADSPSPTSPCKTPRRRHP